MPHERSVTGAPISPGDVTVAILAGGQSRRFGSDKAMAIIPSSGLTLLQHAVGVARQIADDVMVIGGDPERYVNSGARVLPDSVTGHGPVGGLFTALNLASTPYLVVGAVDQPMLTAADLRRLLEGLGPGAAAVFGGSQDGFEPLPVALAVDRCRADVGGLDNRGPLSMRGAILEVGPTVLDPGDVHRRMLDADTRDDLTRIVRILEAEQLDEPELDR